MLTLTFSTEIRKHKNSSALPFGCHVNVSSNEKSRMFRPLDDASLRRCVSYRASSVFVFLVGDPAGFSWRLSIIQEPDFYRCSTHCFTLKGLSHEFDFVFFSQVFLVLSLTRGLSWFSNFYRFQWFYIVTSVFLAVNNSLYWLNNVNCVFLLGPTNYKWCVIEQGWMKNCLLVASNYSKLAEYRYPSKESWRSFLQTP